MTLGHSSPAVMMRYSRREMKIVQDVLSKRRTPYIGRLLVAHPFPGQSARTGWPKKFFSSAISTSFFPSSCSRLAMWRSYCCTVLSSANSSGPFSRNCFFQRPTELGWMPYSLPIWPGVFSPASASRTTWNFNFGDYRFLAMTGAS